MPEPVMLRITKGDVEPGLSSDVVFITDTTLTNSLVRDQATTLEMLKNEVSQVGLEQIEIDPLGRVVVQNQAFVDALKQKLKLQQELGGIICSNGRC